MAPVETDIEPLSLLTEVFDMYRSKQIEPPPITAFAATDIAEAYRYFSSGDRIGKIVISLEDDSKIPVWHHKATCLVYPMLTIPLGIALSIFSIV